MIEGDYMYVIMYHYVRHIRNSKYPNIKGLEVNEFKRQLEWFYRNNFCFITLNDIIEKNNISDKSILLTFDDGYKDHYQYIYPILRQYGIQGVFSVPGKVIREKTILDVNKIHFILEKGNIDKIITAIFLKLEYYRGREFIYDSNEELYNKLALPNRFDDKDTIFVKRLLQAELPKVVRSKITDELFCEFVTDRQKEFSEELYLSMDNISEMLRGGMQFAVHGYDHCWMNRLTEGDIRKDLKQALEVFEGIIDVENWCNCYPYGAYNNLVLRISKELGATSGMGTDVKRYSSECDIFKIPRMDANDFPPKSSNYKNI